MADERVESEIVTQFLLDTCLVRPPLDERALQAAWLCDYLVTGHPKVDVEGDYIPLTTGSVAEFYIEPLLLHVGDIDVMYYQNTKLVIPRGQPPPTQLPAEFHDYVKVFEIIDSHLPAYVYLKLRYLLTYCLEDEKYNYVEYDEVYYEKVYMNEVNDRDSTAHGPARLIVFGDPLDFLSMDRVPCVRCLSWPPQAAEWSTRHRNYDWPDSATVDHVVNDGCDMVQVAHRQCRQHEWMSKFQWRLSFSRAEIVLINSWIPVQQVVYHMSRVSIKNERLKSIVVSFEAGTLSNYHIKTAMLWACELKPRSWWTYDLNLIRTCVELLHTLAVWLSEARCQHYFIHDCNLLDHVDNSLSTSQLAATELRSVTETSLCDWFINCYIRQCAQLCPQHIALLFDDVSTSTSLQNAVAAVVHWRLIELPSSHYSTFVRTQITIADLVSPNSLTVPSCLCWMRELSVIRELLIYFMAFAFLHVSVKILRDSLTDEFLDVLSTICLQSNPVYHRHIARHSSVLSLSKAAKLMKVVANNSRSTVQLIEIELSKAYLHRALRCKDSYSDSIYCLANIYLAVLYYTTGQYQKAIDHCTLVTRSQDHSQCSSHVAQGELLPKINDDIDTVLGLAVLYQYVLSAALTQRQTHYVSVFSTELFARYLHIKCLSVINCHETIQASLPDEIQQYEQCLCESSELTTTDVLGFKFASFVKCQTVKRKFTVLKEEHIPAISHHLDTSELVELLQKSSVEHLTTFRQLEVQRYGRLRLSTITTDFEALYAYKRGQYQRCLQLSTQNVRMLIDHPAITIVFLYPEFTQLMNDDIVSVLALTLIVDPSRRFNAFCVAVDQLTLSVYLMVKCQMQLHHSVTSLDYIQVARRRRHDFLCRYPQFSEFSASLDLLILKLAERIVLRYMYN